MLFLVDSNGVPSKAAMVRLPAPSASGNPPPTVSAITPSTGSATGGTAVTITGTGFLPGASVSLGGTAATGVTVVSATSITATTPSHAAGTVSVVVSNTDNQNGGLPNAFTYTGSTGGGTIGFVQVKAATPQTASSSVAVTYSVAQTAGNLNVVEVGWNDTTSSVNTVTDSKGNSYVLAVGPTSGTGLRQSIYYAKNIAGGSNTVTVTFSKAAAAVDVRILEYSGLDTVSPLDVTAAAAGSGTTANSGAATTRSANELIVGAGMTAGAFSNAGTGFTLRTITSPDADIAEDRTVSATGSYNATAPTSSSTAWVMQMATFRAAQGTSQSGADRHFDRAQHGNSGWRHLGDHHGHRLPGGSDSQAGRDGGDERECREQHVDHGNDTGTCIGSGERGRDEHRYADRHVEQWLHLHGEQSGADSHFDHAQHRYRGWRYPGDHHGHRLPGGSDGEPGRDGGDEREGREQHLDYGNDAGTCIGCGECGRDEHRCAERHVEQRLHLHGEQSGADRHFDHAQHRYGERRYRGDDHGHRLPGGSDGEAGRNGGDGRECGEQHVDYGNDTSTRIGCGECSRDEHRYAERHVEQWLHLRGEQPGADNQFDHAQHRYRKRRYRGDDHGHRLPRWSNSHAGRNVGHERECREQHVDYGNHTGAHSRSGERGGDQQLMRRAVR